MKRDEARHHACHRLLRLQIPVLLTRVRATPRITSVFEMAYTDLPNSPRLLPAHVRDLPLRNDAHRPAHRMILLVNILGSKIYLTLIHALPDQSPHLYRSASECPAHTRKLRAAQPTDHPSGRRRTEARRSPSRASRCPTHCSTTSSHFALPHFFGVVPLHMTRLAVLDDSYGLAAARRKQAVR